jgi:hypothetical protein
VAFLAAQLDDELIHLLGTTQYLSESCGAINAVCGKAFPLNMNKIGLFLPSWY